MRTFQREETKGTVGLLPRENVKFKSSEMAINASKTANSNIICNYYIGLKQQVTTWPPR